MFFCNLLSFLWFLVIFEDFWDCGDFWVSFGTKPSTIFGAILHLLTHFWQSCFLMFFWVLAFLVFCDFGQPEASFWLPFCFTFGSPGPLKKVWKVYNCRQFQRFDPFQTESFCMPWLRVRFDDDFLWIFVILGCFGVPILRPFGTNSCKKWGLKK